MGRIAQLVEQLTLNQRVQGSSPCAPTIGIQSNQWLRLETAIEKASNFSRKKSINYYKLFVLCSRVAGMRSNDFPLPAITAK